MKMLKKNNKAT